MFFTATAASGSNVASYFQPRLSRSRQSFYSESNQVHSICMRRSRISHKKTVIDSSKQPLYQDTGYIHLNVTKIRTLLNIYRASNDPL